MYTSVISDHFKVNFSLISLYRVVEERSPILSGSRTLYLFQKKIFERVVLEYLQNYGKVTLSVFLPEL